VVFTSSNVKTVGRNTLDKLAGHSAGGKMNIFSLSNSEIQTQHLQNTYYVTGHSFGPVEHIKDTLHFVE
jgi:hypothetical protein